VEELLGPRKYYYEVAAAKDRVGVSTGLAWTPWGGEIMFIEATSMPGSGKLMLTGSLGEVLKESAQAALSYIRSNAAFFDIEDEFFKAHDIHVHVPAGAIPKDGPSAGLPIAMALISLVTHRACRRDVALSGELTLSGRILPVSGIREKLLAGRASGVKTMAFPAKNETEIKSIQESVKKDLHILLVQEIKDILDDVLRPSEINEASRKRRQPEPKERSAGEAGPSSQAGKVSGMTVIKDKR
jgi:ATP-dependent Lon protease